MDASDWRSDVQPHARKRAVGRIMNAVKLYNHLDDEDYMQELEKFCQSFEQKTFAGARSQWDYMQKITLKEVSIRRKMQEESYQKIVMLKEMFLPELNEVYQKIRNKIPQLEAESERCKKLKLFKVLVERLISLLHISESDNISPGMSKKLPSYENSISHIIKASRAKGSQIPNNHTSWGASSTRISAK